MATLKTRAEWNAIFTAPATVAGLWLSAAAEWLGLRDLVVNVVLEFQNILLYYQTATKEYVDTKQPGSIYWIPGMAKEYQDGDSLVVVDKIPQYAVIDATKQIVAVVSVKVDDTTGIITFKGAKSDGSGGLEALTNTQRNNWKTYLKKRLGPGAKCVVQSNAADVVKYTISYKYDSLYAKADVETGIEAVLDDFLLNYQEPNGFDGVFYKAQLYENLMGVTGMKSLELVIDMTLSNGNTVTALAEGGEQELPAGYFNWDGTSTKTGTAV